jgi:hypothetical protein
MPWEYAASAPIAAAIHNAVQHAAIEILKEQPLPV